jgi:transposase
VTHIGIDLGRKNSQICILTQEGELIERGVRTERERFAAALKNHRGARILLEAGTESEWVARCLEELGHEVIVADPNYAPMYARRQRKVKTNRRDARALAEACRLGAYRPAHRTSEAQRRVRARIAVREALVRTRSRFVVLIASLLRQEGLSLPAGGTATFLARLQTVTLPEPLQQAIAPMPPVLETLQAQIQEADQQLEAVSCTDPRVRRLRTAPGIGPVTAATFVATVDRVDRFAGPHQLEAYLGLVPREDSTGEHQKRGPITKAGNTRLRWLLIEAAWSIINHPKYETAPLRAWALRIATRRGRPRAVVALARRLAGILFAMMRDETVYNPSRLTSKTQNIAAA